MTKYIIRRVLLLIPTLLMMALITFLVMHATPGSPLEPAGGNANTIDSRYVEQLEELYGLNKPLHEQFVLFVWNAMRGDFGNSYVYKSRSVNEILGSTFPVSLHLGTMSFVFALVGGILLGTISALNQNKAADYVSTGISTFAISLPNFVVAVIMIFIFAIWLGWVPTGGWNEPKDWILPTIALGLGPLAIIARYTRSSMLETLRSDYIRTARAKGLASNQITVRHILKNSLSPVVTVAGPIFAAIATGSFVIESMFRVPGMGKYFVESLLGKDYPLIMAVVLIYGAFLAIMNIVVDVLYALLDPRVRFGSKT
jgi:ABC-type dipeptide/oligopeptide/nickel transport system permease component